MAARARMHHYREGRTGTVVYLEPETHTRLKALSRKTGKPLQALMQEGAEAVLRLHGRNLDSS